MERGEENAKRDNLLYDGETSEIFFLPYGGEIDGSKLSSVEAYNPELIRNQGLPLTELDEKIKEILDLLSNFEEIKYTTYTYAYYDENEFGEIESIGSEFLNTYDIRVSRQFDNGIFCRYIPNLEFGNYGKPECTPDNKVEMVLGSDLMPLYINSCTIANIDEEPFEKVNLVSLNDVLQKFVDRYSTKKLVIKDIDLCYTTAPTDYTDEEGNTKWCIEPYYVITVDEYSAFGGTSESYQYICSAVTGEVRYTMF